MSNKGLMLPSNRLFNNSNIASPGGTASLYLSGTPTPANFLDSGGTSLGPTITANGLGTLPDAYQDETVAYRLVLKDSDGVELDGGDIDPFYFGRDNAVITTAAGSAVSTRVLLAGITGPSANQLANLTEAGREGSFVFDDSDLSTEVTGDPEEGIYVAPSSDATGASGAWVRVVDGKIPARLFGVTEDGTTDDVVALQAALDWAGDKSATIQFSKGATVLIGSALDIPTNASLDLNHGILKLADSDIDWLTIQRNSTISNGKIDAEGITAFTGTVVTINSGTVSTGAGQGLGVFLRDVQIKGKDPEAAAPTGTAIKFSLANTNTHRIAFSAISHCDIQRFEKGVYIDAPDNSTVWCNSNRIDEGTTFYDVVEAVSTNRPNGSASISDWVFDFICQANTTKATLSRILKWDGEVATGRIKAWDTTSSDTTDNKPIELTSLSANNNLLLCGLTPDQAINNYSAGAAISANTLQFVNGSTRSAQPTPSLPLCLAFPTFVGNQDDYFSDATTRSGWTFTASTAVSSGALANIFTKAPNTFAQWTSLNGALELKLDLGASVNRPQAVVLIFGPGQQPHKLKVETSTDDVSYSPQYDKDVVNAVGPVEVWFTRAVTSSARYVKVTLTNTSAKTIVLYRMMGVFGGAEANAYLSKYRPSAESQFSIDGTKVLGPRNTGWTADTGTANKGANATYTAPTISNPPTQAEVQAIADALQAFTREAKSLKDALISHGIIGT